MSTNALSLGTFLESLAARQPTPGGGSASALGGAIGSALGAMAANYTVGSEKYAAFDATARGILERLTVLRGELTQLFDADIAAYDSYRRAAALPKNTDAEKAARTAALNAAREEATVVPERILAAAQAGLSELDKLTRAVNPNLAGDVASGAYFLEACARGAAIQIFSNCTAADPAGANAQRRAAARERVAECQRLRESIHAAVLKLLKLDD